jgi:hypothetical protein
MLLPQDIRSDLTLWLNVDKGLFGGCPFWSSYFLVERLKDLLTTVIEEQHAQPGIGFNVRHAT